MLSTLKTMTSPKSINLTSPNEWGSASRLRKRKDASNLEREETLRNTMNKNPEPVVIKSLTSKTRFKKKFAFMKKWRALFLRINSCWIFFYLRMTACLTVVFFKTPKMAGDWIFKKTKRIGLSFGFAIGRVMTDFSF